MVNQLVNYTKTTKKQNLMTIMLFFMIYYKLLF